MTRDGEGRGHSVMDHGGDARKHSERMLRATFRANARATQDHLRQRDGLELDTQSQGLPKP